MRLRADGAVARGSQVNASPGGGSLHRQGSWTRGLLQLLGRVRRDCCNAGSWRGVLGLLHGGGREDGAYHSHACEGHWITAQCPRRMRNGSPAATPVWLVSLGMGAPLGAPCRRAGGRAVRVRSGSTRPLRRSAPCYVLRCCAARDSLARHDQRGCGQTLGVPPHSTAQAAACRV